MRVKSIESRARSRKRGVALRSHAGSGLSAFDFRLRRPGMTLVELLVVIVIMSTIVAAAIPLMSPSNDDRRMREAARGLNTFITGAQSRAIAYNRPFGIALKRLSQDTKRANDNGVCLEVFYVEQQPAYCGFDANSRACVAIHPNPGNNSNLVGKVLVRFVTRGTTAPGLPAGWTVDLFPGGTIRPGDVIEINGTRFELLADYSAGDLVHITSDANGYFKQLGTNRPAVILAQPLNDSGQQVNPRYDDTGIEIGSLPGSSKPPAPYWCRSAPYKILRQPTSTSDEPYQLPEGTAIDLRASGVGAGDYFYVPGLNDNSEGVIIMFAPEGRVARVSFSQLPLDQIQSSDVFDKPVVDNVYLLVGRRENIPAPDATSKTLDPTLNSGELSKATTDEQRAKLRQPINWLLGTSRWIVIGSQSGRIATIENAFVDLAGVLASPQPPFDMASESTEQMRAAQILAAREFTREMKQLGGR